MFLLCSTTDHLAELFLGDYTYTEGFSLLELEDVIEPQAFAELYPEYNELAGECRFQPCMHDREPGCAVHAAVDDGRLNAVRWARYRQLLSEAKEKWKGRYL